MENAIDNFQMNETEFRQIVNTGLRALYGETRQPRKIMESLPRSYRGRIIDFSLGDNYLMAEMVNGNGSKKYILCDIPRELRGKSPMRNLISLRIPR